MMAKYIDRGPGLLFPTGPGLLAKILDDLEVTQHLLRTMICKIQALRELLLHLLHMLHGFPIQK
jgi:hypothetical protein